MSNKYSPISCSVYDEYELAAIQKADMKITLTSGEHIVSKILDLQTRDKVEYMLLEEKRMIRLDEISSAVRIKA